MKKIVLFIGLIGGICCSCHRVAVPKPYGYARIATPDTAYSLYPSPPVASRPSPVASLPFRFALSENAQAQVTSQPNGSYWMDIYYPALNATIHGSYFAIQNDLDVLTNDAISLVYKHAQQATAIPEQAFVNDDERVYGVLFCLQGNAASVYQFFLTDSVHHFFRASVYCECRPNADSLAPVYDYLEKDIQRLIESWQWVK